MKRLRTGTILGPLVLAAALWSGCDSQQPVSSSPPQSSGSSAVEEKQFTPASAAVWPAPLEKGKEVSLEKNLLTKNYYVILDGSGSMADKGCSGSASKHEAAKRILTTDFIKLIPADANLGLLIFDRDGLSERVPLGTGPDNREAFKRDCPRVNLEPSTSMGQTPPIR